MIWLYVTLGILGLLIISYLIYALIISSYMINQFSKPKFATREERKIENHKMHYEEYEKDYIRTPVSFTMKDGYILNGDYILNDPKKFIIFLHGHSSNREASIKYSQCFYRLGYSLVIYDQRSHGDNQRTYVTMGKKESEDLYEIIKQVRNKFGKDTEIGLFGVSMGGAASLLVTKYTQDLSFIVCDCGFSSLKDMSYSIIRRHHGIPFTLYPFLNLFSKCKYGYTFKDIEPYKVIRNNNVPVLFIHGKEDKTVLLNNGYKNYHNQKGYKHIEVFDGAGHGKCIRKDKNRYYKVIEDFINKVKEN